MPLHLIDLYGALVAFLTAVLLAPVVSAAARAIGWVDRPDARKQHKGHVPLSGGVLILLATLTANSALGNNSLGLGFWSGALAVFVVGLLDDRFPIRARYRLVVQLVAGVCATAWGGTILHSLGELLPGTAFSLGLLAVPLTVIGIAGVINAVNMCDGIDGLAGGLAFTALFWFMVACGFIALDAPQLAPSAMKLVSSIGILMGAAAGFLVWNMRSPLRKRAALFLGDGGSMLLGFALAWLSVRVSSNFGSAGMPPIVALCILWLPIADIASCVVRRIFIEHRTPMAPDRKHLHHLLLALGASPRRAAGLLTISSFVIGGAGVGAWRMGIPSHAIAVAALLGFIAYLMVVLRLWVRLDARQASRTAAPEALAIRALVDTQSIRDHS